MYWYVEYTKDSAWNIYDIKISVHKSFKLAPTLPFLPHFYNERVTAGKTFYRKSTLPWSPGRFRAVIVYLRNGLWPATQPYLNCVWLWLIMYTIKLPPYLFFTLGLITASGLSCIPINMIHICTFAQVRERKIWTWRRNVDLLVWNCLKAGVGGSKGPRQSPSNPVMPNFSPVNLEFDIQAEVPVVPLLISQCFPCK